MLIDKLLYMNNKTKENNTSGKFIQIITSRANHDGTLFEMLYDSLTQKTTLLRWDNEKIEIKDKYIFKDGTKFGPYSPHNPLVHKKLILFAESPKGYGSKQKLLNRIRFFIHRYVDLTETFELIASYYVLLTWLFDKFNEIPYLRVRGDYGSGKTRFLKTIGSLCYKPIFASGASTVAPIFHILNQIGGTLILDEGDFRYSDEKADIAKILNNGNAKGFPVLRCEKINYREFSPVAYEVFGPKIVSSRNDYEDKALESRFICEDMGLRKVRKNIPITLPESFQDEALEIRNSLLLWRLKNHGKIRNTEDYINKAFSLRVNQIYAPLLSLVNSQEDQNKIISFAKNQYWQNKIDAGHDIEVHVLSVIKRIEEKAELPISISEITKLFIKLFENEYDRKITHRFIGSIIRKKLRLRTRKCNGIYILSENQKEKLSHLYEKYDI